MPGVRVCVFCETHMCPHAGVYVSVTTLGRIVVFALKVTQGGEKVRRGENNLERDCGSPSLAALHAAFLRQAKAQRETRDARFLLKLDPASIKLTRLFVRIARRQVSPRTVDVKDNANGANVPFLCVNHESPPAQWF